MSFFIFKNCLQDSIYIHLYIYIIDIFFVYSYIQYTQYIPSISNIYSKYSADPARMSSLSRGYAEKPKEVNGRGRSCVRENRSARDRL